MKVPTNYTPNAKALPSLLDPDEEAKRLKSIKRQKEINHIAVMKENKLKHIYNNIGGRDEKESLFCKHKVEE